MGFLKSMCNFLNSLDEGTTNSKESTNDLYLSESTKNELDRIGCSHNINRRNLVFSNISERAFDEIKYECRRKGIDF